MVPPNSFHTLVKLVNAEVIVNEKIRILHLPVQIQSVTSKLELQILSTDTYDPNIENMFTHTTDLKK